MNTLIIIPEGWDSLGFQIQYVITLIIGLVAFGLLIVGIFWTNIINYYSGWYPVGMCTAVIGGFGSLCLLYPILTVCIQGSTYMKDYEVHGTVVSATNKFKSGTGDLTSIGKPVVLLDGLSTPLFVNDDRVLGMVGEEVDLRCHPVWRYHADAYFTCEVKTFN